MKQIIQHVEAYLDKIYKIRIAGLTDFDSLASELKKDSDELSRNILQTIIEEINDELRRDKAARKEMGLVMHEKDRTRCILTDSAVRSHQSIATCLGLGGTDQPTQMYMGQDESK